MKFKPGFVGGEGGEGGEDAPTPFTVTPVHTHTHTHTHTHMYVYKDGTKKAVMPKKKVIAAPNHKRLDQVYHSKQ
jgi:hypothetical protein